MAEPRKEPRIQIVCGTCGSTDVSRDAWGDWNVGNWCDDVQASWIKQDL